MGLITGTPHRWFAWTSKQSSGWPVKNFGQLSSFLEGGVCVLDLSVYNVYDCSLFLLTFITYPSRCCKAPLHWRRVTVKNENSSNTGFTCLGFFGVATTNYDCFCMLSHCQTNHSSLTTILSTLVTVIVLTFSQWHFVNVNAPSRWNEVELPLPKRVILPKTSARAFGHYVFGLTFSRLTVSPSIL